MRENVIFKPYIKRLGAALTAFFMLAALTSVFSISSGAASYSGSGTPRDPYLIKTADQLLSMRDNLSASYKLADTIDLAGKTVTPIGTLDKPFTGSFMCDAGSDGYPLYAIKNMKIHMPVRPDQGEFKSRWECGLFGATKDATLSYIYVLNADITNETVGKARGSVQTNDFTRGTNELAAGILVAIAQDSSITHCGSTGSVKGATNWAGGLIGRAETSKVEYSFSSASVNSTGFFGVGGFVGTSEYSNIRYCYATGDVTGTGANPSRGGFIGQSARSNGIATLGNEGKFKLENCYSTGKVNASSGSSFAGYSGGNEARDENKLEFSNCYTTGVVSGRSKPWDITVTNCNGYILNNVSGAQMQFAAVSQSDLVNRFKGLSGWTVNGTELPQITDNKPVTSARLAQYVPGAGGASNGAASGSTSGTASTGTASKSTSGTASTGDSAENTPEDTDTADNNDGVDNDAAEGNTGAASARAKEVSDMLKSLPEAEDLTIDNVLDAVKACSAYNALTESEKMTVSEELAAKKALLTNAVQALGLRYVKDGVENLPDVKKLKASDKETVMNIQMVYDFLEEETTVNLSDAVKDKLKAANEKVSAFSDEAAQTTLTTSELILVIVLGVLFLTTLAVTLVVTMVEFKLKKSYYRA